MKKFLRISLLLVLCGAQASFAQYSEELVKATEQGYAAAQNNLGTCYYKGDGVAQSYTEAVKWWQKAAEQGYADAQNNLGICYYKGDGVAQSYVEAVKWWQKAAETGYADAQYNLGYCYHNGDGVIKDVTEAIRWYTKAANQGYRPAAMVLADLEHEAQEHLKQSLETLNNMYPQEIGLGMVVEKVLLDGDYVVYVYKCNEILISIDQLNSNKQNTKSLLKENKSSLEKYDSNFSTFLEVCRAAKKGLEYRYIGNISGRTCIIRIPYSEL